MKKKLLKRTAVLAAVLTLAVSVFAGCGGSQSATEGSTIENSTTENITDDTAQNTTESASENTSKETEVQTDNQTTGEITLEQAKTIALEYVGISPMDTDIYKAEIDGGVYEIEFIYNGFEHEVDVSRTTGQVVKYNKDAYFSGNVNGQPSQENIDMKTAKRIAYEYAGVSAENVTVYKEGFDDGVYEIEFTAGEVKYEVEVRKSTGEVVKFEQETIYGDNASIGTGVGYDGAFSIALNHAGVSADAVYDKEIELHHNRYEIEFKADGYEYEYEISLDGTILKSEKDRD